MYVTATDTGNGTWEMFGIATLYWNLQAPGQGMGIKDASGKAWDGAIPSAFKFKYVTEKDGAIKMARTDIFSDPTAAIVAMLKAGMLSKYTWYGACLDASLTHASRAGGSCEVGIGLCNVLQVL